MLRFKVRGIHGGQWGDIISVVEKWATDRGGKLDEVYVGNDDLTYRGVYVGSIVVPGYLNDRDMEEDYLRHVLVWKTADGSIAVAPSDSGSVFSDDEPPSFIANSELVISEKPSGMDMDGTLVPNAVWNRHPIWAWLRDNLPVNPWHRM